MASSMHNATEMESRIRERIEVEDSQLTTGMEFCSVSELNLPPADRGRAAWTFLAGCFFLEALVWGLPFSFSVFEEYYSTHEPFSAHKSGIATIGTAQTGLIYLSSPFVFTTLQRWPRLRKPSAFVGLGLIIIGLVSASFANSVPVLIITQGVIYGIGGCLLYCPFVTYLDDWFIKRKGLAYGIQWAGTGVGGIVTPLLMKWLFTGWDFRVALRVWAIVVFLILTPLVYFLRPRKPLDLNTSHSFKLGVLKNPKFWLLQCGNIVEGLGVFMPSIYLITYATSIGVSSSNATPIISLLNCAMMLGTILTGFLIDRFHVTTIILFSAVFTTSAVLIIWGLALSTPMLYVFALAYGIFAGGFPATWTGCAKALRTEVPDLETDMVMGLLAAGRGIGSVVSGPISSKLLSLGLWTDRGLGGAYRTNYGILVVFTGASALVGGLGFFAQFKRAKNV